MTQRTRDSGEMTSQHVLYEKRDGIGYVTLNRPEKLNAFSPEMVVRLARLWPKILADRDVRVVLLTGAGDKAFSTGGDLGSLIPIMMRSRPPEDEWEEALAADRTQLGSAILRDVSFFKPIVAAVNGLAYAGGTEMLLSTDVRVASSTARFALTEVRRGLIAGGGSLTRLARQIPWVAALEMCLTGEPIDADHAFQVGLVNRVTHPEEVVSTAEKLAKSISRGAPIALMKTKEAILRSNGRPLEEAFEVESRCTRENAQTADALEGPRAFMEKRDPLFRGC